MKIVIFFILICIAVVNSLIAVDNADAPRPCPIAYKCSNEEDIVWATDGQSCSVYRNDCHLKNENCQRQNRYDQELRKVSKEECQKLCSPLCDLNLSRICAQYNEVKHTFPNYCHMIRHICETGETYSLQHDGSCEE